MLFNLLHAPADALHDRLYLEHPHPSFRLCLTQAALVYGGTILSVHYHPSLPRQLMILNRVGTTNMTLVIQLEVIEGLNIVDRCHY